MRKIICKRGKKCIFFREEENIYYKVPYNRTRKVLHQGDTIFYCKRKTHVLGYDEIIKKFKNDCKYKVTNKLEEFINVKS